MTNKLKERLFNLAVTVVTSFGAVFLSFALFSGEASNLKLDNEIKQKADIEYVNSQDEKILEYTDKRDSEIMDAHNKYEATHQIQHNAEYQALDKKMDLMVKWIESQK